MPSKNQDRRFNLWGLFLHPVTLFLGVAVLVVGVAMALWNQYGERALDQEGYRISADSIRFVNAEPGWAKASVRDLIMLHLKSDSTLDPELVPQAAQVVLSAGWVEHINQIRKWKNGLEVDVSFRQPVACVVTTLEDSLMPVDRHGILMDRQIFKPDAVDSLPRIAVFRPINSELRTWTEWPDSRIQHAASLSGFLLPLWEQLGFCQIVSFQRHLPGSKEEPFELWPRCGDEQGTVVIWGSAPGEEKPGEATALEKLKALTEYVRLHGSFEDSPPGKNIDLRKGRAVITQRIRTANSDKSFAENK